jgi:cell division protein FtsI (penicillin-binding protein 3)
VLETGASSGSAVVLDIATGEVLAMANVPSFNPNAASLGSREAHRNRAVTDLLEPGSTMKPLTVAAALESGAITPHSLFDTNPGWMPNGRYRTTDTHNHGVLDTTGVITKSSNVGAAKIAMRLDNDQFYRFVRRMGYGESTHSGFPGEASGLFPSPARWSGTSKQTMSYGYGLSVTPLQIARVYAALANGGRLITPSFVKGQPVHATQALGTPLSHEVLKMMQTVTEPGGTAYPQGTILGYHVAGKTGTARKASGGGYSRQYVAFFAGVVPVDDPRFAMVVVISDPDPTRGQGYYGGLISAPVFHNVMEGALRLMDVPPDDIDSWLAAQAADEAKRVGKAPTATSSTLPAAVVTEDAQ